MMVTILLGSEGDESNVKAQSFCEKMERKIVF